MNDSQVLDRDTGLYLCQHRYFNPGAGRFITRDPAGFADSLNLYGYVRGNPVSFVDTSGFGTIKIPEYGDLPPNFRPPNNGFEGMPTGKLFPEGYTFCTKSDPDLGLPAGNYGTPIGSDPLECGLPAWRVDLPTQWWKINSPEGQLGAEGTAASWPPMQTPDAPDAGMGMGTQIYFPGKKIPDFCDPCADPTIVPPDVPVVPDVPAVKIDIPAFPIPDILPL